tara:strand:+ start:7650 stop:10730 length:3081 start_codon:yes stop_codon:yes gene_type:complete
MITKELMKKPYTLAMYAMVCFCTMGTQVLSAQSGDQILDGIGETGLIARYLFDGDVKDWSRNNLHGQIGEGNVQFINDVKFGKVLSLSGDKQAFVSIPGEALGGEESLSITGWVNIRSEQLGQRIFDFGKEGRSQFYLSPTGTQDYEGHQARITNGSGVSFKTNSPALGMDKWNHIAVVINMPAKSLSTYLNGVLVSESKQLEVDLAQLFDQGSGAKNQLYIGKSLTAGFPNLNARLHDFRLYRIPLNEKQISLIHSNSFKVDDNVVNETKGPVDDLPQFPGNQPQLYNAFLNSVPDVEVETMVGHLPRLPRYVQGNYRDGISGPKTRVIWPAPTDNNGVSRPGTYTVTGTISGTDLKPQALVTVKATKEPTAPHLKLSMFHLDQVALKPDVHGNSSKFMENRDKFTTTLAQTNPDDFLYMFRNAYGQEQPQGAQPLGVWDSQETKLRGHATGHYLTAIAQAFAGTGHDPSLQEKFAAKMEYMVNTLHHLAQLSGHPREIGGDYVADPTQVPPGPGKTDYDSALGEADIRTDYWNWGVGFISAYPPDQFIMLENGATYGGQKTQIWAPYYTLHKILAGLLDVYDVSGNEKALDIAKGMGNWVHARIGRIPTETLISMWNRYIAGEFGGMNEVMARLYRVTEERRYLEVAQLFDNIKVFFGDAGHSHGLAKNVDTFRGLHANQHIPQIIGALEMYGNSDMPEYYRIADNFWYKAMNDYMYSIGGVAGARNPANAECFIGQPATLYENGLSSGGQNETCATYNMLKLTQNLFLYDQRAELMDYYERGLYNHILASVAEDSPANTYHVPLRPGSIKRFGNADMKGFTCCNGTALESSTKLQNSIYFKSADNKALYVNLFVPSELKWTERKVTIEQATAFPNEDHTLLTIHGNGKFDLNVRIPKWATNGFFVHINGKEEKVKAEPGSYLTLNRAWKDGDTVELRMPFGFHLDPVMDQQNIASLFYGPILLAAQESEARQEWRKVTLNMEDIGKSIAGDPKKLEFLINGVLFKPFYETYGRHSVYLDVTLE